MTEDVKQVEKLAKVGLSLAILSGIMCVISVFCHLKLID